MCGGADGGVRIVEPSMNGRRLVVAGSASTACVSALGAGAGAWNVWSGCVEGLVLKHTVGCLKHQTLREHTLVWLLVSCCLISG